MSQKKVYKIFNKVSGLWSRGGQPASWGTRGKVWSSRGAMSNHIRLQETYDRVPDPDNPGKIKYVRRFPEGMKNWVVMEYVLVESATGNAFSAWDHAHRDKK